MAEPVGVDANADLVPNALQELGHGLELDRLTVQRKRSAVLR